MSNFSLLSWLRGRCVIWFAVAALGAAAAPFDDGWRFHRGDLPGAEQRDFPDAEWAPASLPHSPRIEALVAGNQAPQWQGICWYRKRFQVPAAAADRLAFLRFEGAMNIADVWVNGRLAGSFQGGYLPYVLDVTRFLQADATNLVAVRLDNRDNPITGPKPLADLDFNLYGGLYRRASLTFKDPLHITDPLLANEPAGGGIFVTTPLVTATAATVRVQTHIRNAGAAPRQFYLRTTLLDPGGAPCETRATAPATLAAGAARTIVQEFRVASPHLWSIATPNLYQVRSAVIASGQVVDEATTRIGIRHFEITPAGFRLNGEPLFLRGVNRHQEYPYIGYALSDAAQYRDARKIKEAGFDYVRLSHYPQSPAFLDACDELGLVVMNCLMGWQYFGADPAFAELKYQEVRQLIRRDRNHPCVLLWEVSLNETDMPREFIARTHAIAHEEFPGGQMFTCGWTRGYDVFLQARQHGGCQTITNVPCVVSEYGDWEYYAQNAGLAQHLWKDLAPAERNSRQRRGDGEVRLLQQALNFQEAHNDNRKTRAFADGLWVMFDYNRGYAPDIEASGVLDLFRLPKPAREFFRSQRGPEERVQGRPHGPVLFIANRHQADSPRTIRIFSNCDEVELFRNGHSLGRRRPDRDRVSTHLAHPPFTFVTTNFLAGTLRAVGYRRGQPVVEHSVATPGTPATLALTFDLSHRPFAAEAKDAIFTYAELRDAQGTVVPTNGVPVTFGQLGQARLVGHNPLATEAGIATILLESDRPSPRTVVGALVPVRTEAGLLLLSAAAAPDGSPAPPAVVRFTTDGSAPTITSPSFSGPLSVSVPVRAVLFVGEEPVASVSVPAAASSGAPETAAASR